MDTYYMFNGKAVKITGEEQKLIRERIFERCSKLFPILKKKYPDLTEAERIEVFRCFNINEFHEHQSLIAEHIYNSRPAPQK